MRAVAPAKINLTLEVLGKREDGFHEIRSVMQTVTIIETLQYEASDTLALEVQGPHEGSVDDLVLKAVRTLAESHDIPPTGRFRLWKRIPAAAGLGGGSSDAAAALRILDRAYDLRTTPEERAAVAAKFSSDAPFFCVGGTALVSGRGEIVEPLADIEPFWMVIIVSPLTTPNKTQAMYEALEPGDFAGGERTADLARRIGSHERVEPRQLYNAFERAALGMFDGLAGYKKRLKAAGAAEVHLAGSGPALFALAASEAEANAIRERLDAPDCVVQVARSLGAAEATAVYE